MDLNLNVIVNNAMEELSESGFVEEKVKKMIEQSIEGIISSTFSTYSKFGRELENEIEAKLKVDLSQLNIDKYNQLVTNVINSTLKEKIEEDAMQRLKENIAALITPDKEIKLSTLMEMMIDYDVDFDGEENHEIMYSFKDDGGYFKYICMDPNSFANNYSCKYRIGLNNENEVYSLRIDGKDASDVLSINQLDAFSRELFSLYASRGTIILDETEFNTFIENTEDEDEDEW
ncbi:hypothetical protein FZW91_02505 [Listeria monocytogenes]|uniref:hypothetical protein n=1 Tax=Listeria monocytogenes TaxID=1639 RepID=UPI0011F0B89B|nr:hypothetical protein [Listeria monocytogenes]TYU25374.1 hypothetical protein FZW91_02505 [Listeria monocytogenes]